MHAGVILIIQCSSFFTVRNVAKVLDAAAKNATTEAFAASRASSQKFFGKIHDSLARLYFIGLQGKEGEDIHKGACAVFHVLSLLFFISDLWQTPQRNLA